MAKVTQSQINRVKHEVQLFEHHAVQGKSVVQSAKDIGLSRTHCFEIKRSDNYRLMALALLEKKIDGIPGVVSKLVEALDAVRPHNKITKKTVKGVTTEKVEVVWVADNNTRDKALKKVIDIYGLNAPKQTDVNVAVSFSSDAELFEQIDEAERSCKFVQSYEKGKDGFELATDPSGAGSGDFESRQRTLLQGAAVP